MADASIWSEHTTPDGKTYYFNKTTGKSVWEKPAALMGEEEQKKKAPVSSSVWTEHTAESGRKYYYNAETKKSVWEKPEDLWSDEEKRVAREKREEEERIAKEKEEAEAAELAALEAEADEIAAAARAADGPAVYATKQEAEGAFTALLSEAGVRPSWTWDQTMQAIIRDHRYNALVTLKERKEAFKGYIEEQARKDREAREKQMAERREAFMAMLRAHDAVDVRTGMRRAEELFAQDERWKAISSDRERADLLDDHVFLLEEAAREQAEARTAEALEAYRAILSDPKQVSLRTQWRGVREVLDANGIARALGDLQALEMFEARMRELDRAHHDEQRISRAQQRRTERKARDAFRALLRAKLEAGELSPSTRWKAFKPTIEGTDAYRNMLGNHGSTPGELFGDVMEIVHQRHLKLVERVRAALDDAGVAITQELKETELSSALASAIEEPIQLSEADLGHVHDSLLEVARKEHARALKEMLRNFRLMLKGYKEELGGESPPSWEDFAPRLAEESSFLALEDQELRRATYVEFLEKLKDEEQMEDNEDSSEEEGRILSDDEESPERGTKRRRKEKSRRRKHRHKRHRHHRSSRRDESSDSDGEHRHRHKRRHRSSRHGSSKKRHRKEKRDE